MKASLTLLAALAISPVFATDLPDPLFRWKMDRLVDGKVPDEMGSADLTVGEDCFLSNGVNNAGQAVPSLYFPGTLKSLATFSCPGLLSRTVVVNVCREAGDGPLDASVNAIPYLLTGLSSLNIEMRRENDYMKPWLTGYNGEAHVYPADVFSSKTRESWRQLAFVVEVTGETAEGAKTGNLYVYVDGVQVISKTGVTFTKGLANAGTCFLGNNSSKGERPLFGHLGEVRVYDEALSSEQIVELRMRGLHGQLMVRWNMNRVVKGDDGSRTVEDDGPRALPLRIGPSVTVTNDLDGGVLKFNPVDAQTLADSWSYANVPCDVPELTFSLWYNLSSTLADTYALGNNIPRIFSLNGGYRFMINNSSAVTDRTMSDLDIYLPGDTTYRRFTGAYIERDTWAHIAVTTWLTKEDGKNIGHFDVYVNGEKFGETTSGETTISTFLPSDSSTVMVGAAVTKSTSDNIRAIKGSIDDVRIYAGRLSDEEIRQIWRSPATVDAGADFTVATETATLRGSIGKSADLPYRHGYAGEPSWRLLSSPSGGEEATIEQSKSAVTRVTLPVSGAYVFELSCTAMGVATTNTVTVTRIAPSSGNQPPTVALASAVTFPLFGQNALKATVADPDEGPGTLRVSWKKLSGPGGVWFDPADAAATEIALSAAGDYVLRCTAEDGQDATFADIAVTVTGDGSFDPQSLTNGMFAFYPFTNGAITNFVAGGVNATMKNFNTSKYSQHFPSALNGHGYRGYDVKDYADLGAYGFGESGSSAMPTDKWRTISLWMYHDSTGRPGGCIPYNPSLVSHRGAFDFIYLDNPKDGNHGFWAFQAYDGNKWGCPAKDPANRWTHVVVMLDRHAEEIKSDASELWVDGVKQTVTAVADNWKSRSSSTSVAIGGCHYSQYDPSFHPDFCLTNDTYGITSRTFPGIIDEVRFYNRRLTDVEIRYLATHPCADEHNAPSTDAVVPDKRQAVARDAVPLAVTAHGDGIAFDSALTYAWQILSGDASALAFADETARATTVTIRKKGRYVVQLRVSDGERTTYSDPITLDVVGRGMVFYLR